MSIKVLTVEEAKQTEARARAYGEVCEVLVGKAKDNYFCDNSSEPIPKGSQCAAVMVLPYKEHPNYQHQLNMLAEYVEVGAS